MSEKRRDKKAEKETGRKKERNDWRNIKGGAEACVRDPGDRKSS